jgi:hypothetical protein
MYDLAITSHSIREECSTRGKKRRQHKTLRGSSVGISRRGWDDNNKMYLREIGLESVIHVAPDRNRWQALMNFATKFRVP